MASAFRQDSPCPRCGAAGWDDAGQRHELVAFRLARSFTAQHESLTRRVDEVEHRRPAVVDLRGLDHCEGHAEEVALRGARAGERGPARAMG